MAGTRLLTQLSFVLGVLSLIPVVLWLMLPPGLHLWHSSLSADVPSLSRRGGPPHLPLIIHVILTSRSLAETYRPHEVESALSNGTNTAVVIIDHREMELEEEPLGHGGDASLSAEKLFQRLEVGGSEREAMEYWLFVLNQPGQKGEDTVMPLELSPSEAFGWVTTSPLHQGPSSSSSHLTAIIVSAIHALVESIQRPPPPSPPPLALHQPVRVTLLNEDPHVVACGWDFDQIMRRLDSEIRSLEPLTRLSFMSEVPNYGSFPAGDRFRVGNDTVISTSSLSSWSVEMGATLPPSSAHGGTLPLHIVVLCPKAPLQLYNDAQVQSDAIYVPGWGGAVILDPRPWPPTNHHHHHHQASRDDGGGEEVVGGERTTTSTTGMVMMPDTVHAYMAEVIVSVVRGWMGLEGTRPPTSSSSSRPLQVMSALEWDRLLHFAYTSRMEKAARTLRSIQEVVAKHNRVLTPSAKAHWHSAVTSLTHALHPPSSSIHLANDALSHAQEAWGGDDSLLPSAHFPIEHHVAVLVPLIVPLLVPLFGGLRSEWKRYRDKTKTTATGAGSSSRGGAT